MRARLCTALVLLPLVLGGHARAAEDELKVITLSCDGMLIPTYGDNKPADPQPLQKASVVADRRPCSFWATSLPSKVSRGPASISEEGCRLRFHCRDQRQH